MANRGFPKWAIDAINSQMAIFFWDEQDGNHKYHFVNWQLLAQKKDQGGMSVPDLRDLSLITGILDSQIPGWRT